MAKCGPEESNCDCAEFDASNITFSTVPVVFKRVVIQNYPDCGDSIDINCQSTENLIQILALLGLSLKH